MGTAAAGWLASPQGQDLLKNWFANENNNENEQCEVPKSPPEGLVENPDRPGSWGEYDENGKFREKWRYDKGRSEIKKGHGSEDHIQGILKINCSNPQ